MSSINCDCGARRLTLILLSSLHVTGPETKGNKFDTEYSDIILNRSPVTGAFSFHSENKKENHGVPISYLISFSVAVL